MSVRILEGDALTVLRTLPDCSVQMCVTSPPYFGLRDDGVAGQLGLEKTPQLYVDAMVGVFSEVKRVLRDDGTLWLNIGDSYAGSWGSQGHRTTEATISRSQIKNHPKRASHTGTILSAGVKPKDLYGLPWMLAFALRADGWYLRSDIIWSKPNPMPESVTDRPTKAHEYVFLLSKSSRYFYDADAIRTALQPKTLTTFGIPSAESKGNDELGGVKADNWARTVPTHKPRMKMPDGWDTGPGGHGSFHRNGREKGETKERGHKRPHEGFNGDWDNRSKEEQQYAGANARTVWTIGTYAYPEAHFATFPPQLAERCILAGSTKGQTVLDPFGGAGTTGLVADRLGRDALLIELNPKYAAMARERIHSDNPLFGDVA